MNCLNLISLLLIISCASNKIIGKAETRNQDNQVILQVLENDSYKVQNCAQKSDIKPKTKVYLSFQIMPDGQTQSVSVSGPTNEILINCILSMINHIRFPPIASGEIYDVRTGMQLSPR